MSICRGFGEWTSIVRGDLAAREGFALATHLCGCDACRGALREARLLDRGLRGAPIDDAADPRAHAMHDDALEMAVAIARGEFPPEAWACEECTELLVASIGSTTPAATESQRRGSRRIAAPLRIAGVLAAAAVLAFAVLAIAPPSQPWARAAGLRHRASLWLVPPSIAAEVERVVSSGRIAPPRFTLSEARREIERSATGAGDAPHTLSPRWEAVEETRPEFHWTGTGVRAEVFLLDGQRRYLRHFEAGEQGKASYPDGAVPLSPGATYYWKVNVFGQDAVRASEYTGFTVLPESDSRECERQLASVAGSPFMEAVVAERCGLYAQAAAAFDRAPASGSDPEIASRFARQIRHRQGLDEHEPRE